jgi:hypothetical protein
MMNKKVLTTLMLLLTLALTMAMYSNAVAEIVVGPGFQATVVASGINGNGIAVAPNSFGAHAGHVFITDQGLPENLNDGIIHRVNPTTGVVSTFASTPGNPAHLTFAPGGAFGTDLYVSTNQDPANPFSGIIWRVNNAGNATNFGTQDPDGNGGGDGFVFGAAGIAFSPGGPFGENLYSGVSAGASGDAITRLTSAGGTATLFHNLGTLDGNPTGLAFGTGTAGFSQDLYSAINGSPATVESGVYVLDSLGQRTELVTASSPNANGLITSIIEIEFAPGGVFGDSLYSVDLSGRILGIDSSGNTIEFASGLSIATGLAFGDSQTLYAFSGDTLYAITPVPEPGSGAIILASLLGMGLARRRRLLL